MSLKAFHIFFISVSTLLLIGFEFWGVRRHLLYGDHASLAMAGAAGVGVLALMWYATWFVRKLRDVSW